MDALVLKKLEKADWSLKCKSKAICPSGVSEVESNLHASS